MEAEGQRDAGLLFWAAALRVLQLFVVSTWEEILSEVQQNGSKCIAVWRSIVYMMASLDFSRRLFFVPSRSLVATGLIGSMVQAGSTPSPSRGARGSQQAQIQAQEQVVSASETQELKQVR